MSEQYLEPCHGAINPSPPEAQNLGNTESPLPPRRPTSEPLILPGRSATPEYHSGSFIASPGRTAGPIRRNRPIRPEDGFIALPETHRTTSHVAARIGASVTTVKRLANRGAIRCVRVGAGRYGHRRIPESEVKRLEREAPRRSGRERVCRYPSWPDRCSHKGSCRPRLSEIWQSYLLRGHLAAFVSEGWVRVGDLVAGREALGGPGVAALVGRCTMVTPQAHVSACAKRRNQ
jgi:excisionase family DNA binding protein